KRWTAYPDKDGKKEALRHWNASVKNEEDLADFDMAFCNYKNHLLVTGFRAKTGKVYFNNWRDFIQWVEPTTRDFGRDKESIPPIARRETQPQPELEPAVLEYIRDQRLKRGVSV